MRTVSEWDVLRYGLLHGPLPASYKVSEAHLIIQCIQQFLSFLTHFSLCPSRCHGQVVIREGNATADTVCQPFVINVKPRTATKEPHVETGFPTASPTMMTTGFDLEKATNFSQIIPLVHTVLSENTQGTVNELLCSVGSIMRETLRFYQGCNIAFFLCLLALCLCQHLLLC